jgi:hypothetical protein
VRTIGRNAEGKLAEIDIAGTGVHYVASCESCRRLLLYQDQSWGHVRANFRRSELASQSEPELLWWVPDNVLQHYFEAERVRHQSPNAFAVQIRRSLEALCDDRGAVAGHLNKRLNDLVGKGILPAVLGDAAAILRQLGNRGAHHGRDLDRFDVYRIEEFYRAIIDFVYTIPHRIHEVGRAIRATDDNSSGA